MANVDQLSLAESSRWKRAVVIFVRTGFLWQPGGPIAGALYPVVLMLGYSNLPEDFDARLPEFQAFVDAVDWEEEELAAARQAVLACTAAETVRVALTPSYHCRNTMGLYRPGGVRSPDVTPEELECFGSQVCAVGRSFVARRTPFAPPAVAPPPPPPAPPFATDPAVPPPSSPEGMSEVLPDGASPPDAAPSPAPGP